MVMMTEGSANGMVMLERSVGERTTSDELFDIMEMRPKWWQEAACRRQPLEIFFPADARSSRPAKIICGVCPVRQQCLDYALQADPPLKGIFGGMTEQERRTARRMAGSAAS